MEVDVVGVENNAAITIIDVYFKFNDASAFDAEGAVGRFVGGEYVRGVDAGFEDRDDLRKGVSTKGVISLNGEDDAVVKIVGGVGEIIFVFWQSGVVDIPVSIVRTDANVMSSKGVS